MPMSPRLLRPRQGGDPDALRYIAAVQAADGQPLESGVRKAINDFVVGCKRDNIWSAIKASCILAGARTLAGALTPLAGAAPTNFNFVSGDYNRKTGLVGNGTSKYLDSNRNNNADPQNSKHASAYVVSVTTQTADVYIGSSIDNAGGTSFFRGSVSTNWRVNATGTSSILAVANASMTGFCGVSRSSASSFQYRAAGSTATASVPSATPENANVHVFAGANAFHADCRLAWYSIGEAVDLALLDSRVATLYTAIGAAIP